MLPLRSIMSLCKPPHQMSLSSPAMTTRKLFGIRDTRKENASIMTTKLYSSNSSWAVTSLSVLEAVAMLRFTREGWSMWQAEFNLLHMYFPATLAYMKLISQKFIQHGKLRSWWHESHSFLVKQVSHTCRQSCGHVINQRLLRATSFYYPTLLRRVQISRETSTNITRYLYSSHSSRPREVQNLGKSEFWEKKSLDNKSLIRRFGV